jgi:drug/metabolite transporter (DMT)-like permease
VIGRNLALLALMGVGQIGLGLLFLVVGARLIPAVEVALITLLEIVLAPLWVWIAISETPAPTTLIGGAVIVGAVILQATGSAAGERLQSAVDDVRDEADIRDETAADLFA